MLTREIHQHDWQAKQRKQQGGVRLDPSGPCCSVTPRLLVAKVYCRPPSPPPQASIGKGGPGANGNATLWRYGGRKLRQEERAFWIGRGKKRRERRVTVMANAMEIIGRNTGRRWFNLPVTKSQLILMGAFFSRTVTEAGLQKVGNKQRTRK